MVSFTAGGRGIGSFFELPLKDSFANKLKLPRNTKK
jgi:hypothetical protein